jgi:hypothetical protein
VGAEAEQIGGFRSTRTLPFVDLFLTKSGANPGKFTISLPFLYHFRECRGRGRPRSEREWSALVSERSSHRAGERSVIPLAQPASERCCGRGRPRSGKTLLFLYLFHTKIAFERCPVRAHSFQPWRCSCCSLAGMALNLMYAYLIFFPAEPTKGVGN